MRSLFFGLPFHVFLLVVGLLVLCWFEPVHGIKLKAVCMVSLTCSICFGC